MNVLKVRFNQTEQTQLSNSWEIRSITPNAGETTKGLICSKGATLGIKLGIEDLNYVERIRTRREDPQPPPNVVWFVHQAIINKVIRLSKVKMDYFARHLDRNKDEKTCQSKEMSTKKRHLYWFARKKRTTEKLNYVWFTRGRIWYHQEGACPDIIN